MPSEASRERLTRDTTAAKRARVRAALADPRNRYRSNRDLGRDLGVDEAMVRDWKKQLGIPALLPFTGEAPPVKAGGKKRGRRAKNKKKKKK